MKCGEYELDIGCGRAKEPGYIGIDKVQIIDGKGIPLIDVVRDVERGLPFCDNSAKAIKATSVLEHIEDLGFVMNECWRVLKPDGILWGTVPIAGTGPSFRDPTHKRFFAPSTFNYFCGESLADPSQPKYPRYSVYGFLPWIKVKVEIPDDGKHIYFELKPRK